MSAVFRDLIEEIGHDATEYPNYCGERYWDWEQQVADNRLRDNGWTVKRWYTIEGDSFGPTIRGCDAWRPHDLNLYTFTYGGPSIKTQYYILRPRMDSWYHVFVDPDDTSTATIKYPAEVLGPYDSEQDAEQALWSVPNGIVVARDVLL